MWVTVVLMTNHGVIRLEKFVGVPITGEYISDARHWCGWCRKERHKDYIGSGQISLRPVRASCVLAQICSRGLQMIERGKGLPSLWAARVHVRVRVLMVLLFHRPLPLFPSSPFIVHGEGKGQI